MRRKSGRSDRNSLNWSPAGAPRIVVNVQSAAALLDDLRLRLEEGRGFSVATLNLDHVVKLRRDRQFCSSYAQQTHVTADGNPVVWLSKLAGDEVYLVPGSELITPVVALAAENDWPVAFLGSDPETLDLAAQNLETAYPGLRIVSRISPPMGFDPQSSLATSLLDEVAASGARVCCLALGAPKQETLAAIGYTRHPDLGFLSIGAGLDFIAGSQTRAPLWVRRLASEWIWRLASNPGRLAGRYAACLAILPSLVLGAIRHKRTGSK